jgi:catechol 2,3-dioxygenase-like lactoylglutathione lyase family enzyme
MADPLLTRIRCGTVAAPDVEAVVALYTKWLGYKAVEKGTVDAAQAAAWGAPAMAGRASVLLQPASKGDVYVRVVGIDPVANFRPLSSWGWGAIEILVQDPPKLHRKLTDSPFMIIGKPRFLNGYPTIQAMQVRGPANEVLYLTADTGPRDKSLLAYPESFVGRPFIMVVAGPDPAAMQNWYAKHFRMAKNPVRRTQIDVIQQAQGLPEEHAFTMGFMALAAPSHYLELDGYPSGTGPRPRHHGQLPPGVAMASFEVPSLDKLKVPFVAPPATLKGRLYGGARSALAVGPAGELLELIET